MQLPLRLIFTLPLDLLVCDISLRFLHLSLSQLINYAPLFTMNPFHRSSSRHVACKDTIPFFQFLSLSHKRSQCEALHFMTSDMSPIFRNCGFPLTVVDGALTGIFSILQMNALNTPPPDRTDVGFLWYSFFTLWYHRSHLHPTGPSIQQIIL